MASKDDLAKWVRDALEASGGGTTLVNVAKHIWRNHEAELKKSGDLFYTWQYDMRWAATNMRKSGAMTAASRAANGKWHLASKK